MALVSFIVPCYRQARFLPEALESVRAQTHEEWECLVVDDGSPDATREVAAAFAGRDRRFRLVEQPHRGVSAARNRGLREARGEWIQFLDADDVLLPDKLRLQLAALAVAQGLAVAVCDYWYGAEDDPFRRIDKGHDFEHPRFRDADPLLDLAARWETDLSIPPHCFLFAAAFFRELGVAFDETLPTHEDWDCWMRIFAARPALVAVERELVVYRQHSSSKCNDHPGMWEGYSRAILKQLAFLRDEPRLAAALRAKHDEMREIYARKLAAAPTA